MSTYGLPSSINLVAYDCVSGLLAIGNKLMKETPLYIYIYIYL